MHNIVYLLCIKVTVGLLLLWGLKAAGAQRRIPAIVAFMELAERYLAHVHARAARSATRPAIAGSSSADSWPRHRLR